MAMNSLDYWLNKNKKSIAFYTDEKGRQRLIIKKHKDVTGSHYVSDQELLNYVKSILYEYCEEAGVKARPEVTVNNRWRRKIAHVKFNIFDGEVGEPIVYADKILRFSLAHEVGHLKQREEYGYNILVESPIILE